MEIQFLREIHNVSNQVEQSIRNFMRKRRYFLIINFLLSFCFGCESPSCETEKQYYQERWDFTIEKSYKDLQHKATHVLVTKQGREITFQPIQDIVFFANKGDRLVKTPYSKYAYLVTQYGDSSRYRIFSKTCDSELDDQFK